MSMEVLSLYSTKQKIILTPLHLTKAKAPIRGVRVPPLHPAFSGDWDLKYSIYIYPFIIFNISLFIVLQYNLMISIVPMIPNSRNFVC